jgi:3',5'-cyclic AMP phosphodiesterase CpdA
MKLAHFSDFHLGHPHIRRQKQRLRGLVDHAIAQGAEHLLFGGDLLDHANLDDLSVLVEHLRSLGWDTSARCSVVPGNHDIWPFGEEDVLDKVGPFLRAVIESAATGDDWPAQQNYQRFLDTFAFAFEGTLALDPDDPLPCTKRVGPWLLGLLDTVSDRSLHPAQGRFKRREGRWLRKQLARHEGPRLLLMHHWPFAWEASNVAEKVAEVLASLPWPLRKALALAEPSLAAGAASVVDVGFRRLDRVQRFIQRSGADVVLCGHLHMMSDDPRDADFTAVLGDVPVHCMGRSGGVHQGGGDGDVLAYHLLSPGDRGVQVETVYVSAASLGQARGPG